jgi:hypothetical protein
MGLATFGLGISLNSLEIFAHTRCNKKVVFRTGDAVHDDYGNETLRL